MKNIVFLVLTTMLLSFLSCSSENEVDESSIPTDLSISGVKFGADVNNPNGDGSGVVDFAITATNATSYKVLINNETLELSQKPLVTPLHKVAPMTIQL